MKQQSDQNKLQEQQARILARKGLICCGPDFSVALHSKGKAAYIGADRFGQSEVTRWEQVTHVACSARRVVAVMKDGSIRFTGNDPVYATHRDLFSVRSVSCSATHTAILLGNGRVAADPWGGVHEDLSEWPAVIDAVCGNGFVAGLTPDGHIVTAGGNRFLRHVLSTWTHIAGIFTDYQGDTVYGITDQKRILSTRPLPRRVRDWSNLIYLAADRHRIWGVTSAGELLSTDPLAEELKGRSYFVACAVSPAHTVALTRYGTVLAAGDSSFGQCDTAAMGTLFSHFDDLMDQRRDHRAETYKRERAYQHALTRVNHCKRMLCGGPRLSACITVDSTVMVTGNYHNAKKWEHVRALACGNAHLIGLTEDGTVLADGNPDHRCTEVGAWTRIRAIAAGKYYTLGLTEEGDVRFCGQQESIERDVADWSRIKRVYAHDSYAVGVDYEGRIRIAGDPPFSRDLIHEGWMHPVDVALTETHMTAVYADGNVLTTEYVPASLRPGDGEVWNTCDWHYIREIAAGYGFTVGLTYGGRVESVSRFKTAECDTSSWQDIVSVGCGHAYAAGLTVDGRVLIAPVKHLQVSAEDVLPNTSMWSGVIAIHCAPHHIIALTKAGQLLAAGSDSDRQCSATAPFLLFRKPEQIYGYGKHRERLEQELETRRTVVRNQHKPAAQEGMIPFSLFAGAMRENTKALLSRITGSENHLTVLDTEGKAVTYFYATAERIVDGEEGMNPAHMVAAPQETLLVYPDGRARVRQIADPSGPLTLLPNRLGDSHFYPVADAAFGDSHSVVLLRDGTLRAFGENDRGQGDVGGWSHIITVACGTDHTVGLREDGTVVATGARHRESGNRARGVAHTPRANPCAVGAWRGVTAISCAGDVTVGLCHDGTVKAVGSSHYGQCATEKWRGVVSVATSGNHTVALFADGHVEAVGLNENGECRTEDWSRVVMIAVMPELTLGLRADGKVLAAGRHHQVLDTLEPVRAMACFGGRRQVFVMADGTLRIHNRGSEYLPEPLSELYLFKPSSECSVLLRASLSQDPAAVSRALADSLGIGMVHTAALGEKGAILADGANENGQCDIRNFHTAVRISAGPYHTAAICSDGRISMTGRGGDGRCDYKALNRELLSVDATLDECRAAVEVGGPTKHLIYGWLQVSCGYDHTAALRSDGRVYAVGANPDGRCDTRKWRDITRVECGIRHTVGITADGSCVATGDNRYGQCELSLWKQITAVAAGEFHTVGLRADGRVEAVGDNRKGQCHVEDLRDVVGVACLPDATLCIRADGTVIIRGGSGEHDKAVEALQEIVAIRTCEHRIAALTADRRLIIIP